MTEKVIKKDEVKKDFLVERGMFQLETKDDEMLHACYMPSVKGCGFFYPGKIECQIGDEVFLLLKLLDDERYFGCAGKVVLINPKQKLGKRFPGIGLQLTGRDVEIIKTKIEEKLGKKSNSVISTATM